MAPTSNNKPKGSSTPSMSNSKTPSRSTSPRSSASRSTSTSRSRSATPSPPNKDKPLPPYPPVERSAYPSIDPSRQPRTSPIPPPTIRGASIKKASKILGTSALVTSQLSHAAQLSQLSYNLPKAEKVLGITTAKLADVRYDRTNLKRNEGVKELEWESERKSMDEAQTSSPGAVTNGARSADVSPVDQHVSRTSRGHRRNWGSSSSGSQASGRSRADSQTSNRSRSASNSSTVSNGPVLRPIPSLPTTVHRQHSSLSRIIGSPSSVYSDGPDPSPLDLENELAETQAFWAKHPLTVTSPNGESIRLSVEGAEPYSPGLHRRSKSLTDLQQTGQLQTLFEPLPLQSVPEWGSLAPLPLHPQQGQLTAIKPSLERAVVNVASENADWLKTGYNSSPRAEVKVTATAAKVMKRLTLTKPLALNTTSQTEQRPPLAERSRASVNWAKAVKSLTKDRGSVDEIIPMRGPNAISAAQQAQMLEKQRRGKGGSKDKITLLEAKVFKATVLQPIQTASQAQKAEHQTGKRETTFDQLNDGTKVEAQIGTSPEAKPAPLDQQAKPRKVTEPDTRAQSEAETPILSQPEAVSHHLPRPRREDPNRDSNYYRTKIAAANSLFDKFIQNPDDHQVKLQRLIDDTRHERKTMIEGAQPLDAWYEKQFEIEELAKASGVRASQLSMPSKMPSAPPLLPAPHHGISTPRLETSVPPNKQTREAKLETRVTSPKYAVTRRASRRNSRRGPGSRRKPNRNGLRSPRSPLARTKTEKGTINIFHFKSETPARKVSQSISLLPLQEPASSPWRAQRTKLRKKSTRHRICQNIQRNIAKKDKTKRINPQIISRPMPFQPVPNNVAIFPYPSDTPDPINHSKEDKGKQDSQVASKNDPGPLLTLAPTVYVPQSKPRGLGIDAPVVSPPADSHAATLFSPVSPEVMVHQASPLPTENPSTVQAQTLPISHVGLAAPNLTNRFDSAMGTPEPSRSASPSGLHDSPILPTLEATNDDDDDDVVSVKSFSYITPGVETPNYHALDWWETGSPDGLDLNSPEMNASVRSSRSNGRTMAEIKSWQFDLDDELARLRQWDWEENEDTTMMFTLDFNSVHA